MMIEKGVVNFRKSLILFIYVLEVKVKSTKRKVASKHLEHPSTMLLKLVDILDQLNSLVVKEALPDSILLDINNISLPTFFVEGIHTMQLSALNVIRSVCIVFALF
jgi:hypothetical protein